MDQRYIRFGWLVAVLAVLGGVFVLATLTGRKVAVACTRADGCTLRARTLLWPLESETVPLARIQRFSLGVSLTTVQSSRSRTSSMTESVIVVLADGGRIELDDYSLFDGFTHDKSDAVTALEAFRTDPSIATVAVDFGGFTSALLATLVFDLFLVPVGLYLVLARVYFEPAELGGLRVVAVRGVLRAVGESQCIVRAGDTLELDARRRLYYRRGGEPRVDVPIPPMSRGQLAALVAALERAIAKLA